VVPPPPPGGGGGGGGAPTTPFFSVKDIHLRSQVCATNLVFSSSQFKRSTDLELTTYLRLNFLHVDSSTCFTALFVVLFLGRYYDDTSILGH